MRPSPPDVLLLLFERFELPPERPELGRFELRLREEAEPPEERRSMTSGGACAIR